MREKIGQSTSATADTFANILLNSSPNTGREIKILLFLNFKVTKIDFPIVQIASFHLEHREKVQSS